MTIFGALLRQSETEKYVYTLTRKCRRYSVMKVLFFFLVESVCECIHVSKTEKLLSRNSHDLVEYVLLW